MSLYLGLISGTSMDCIDAALLDVGPSGMRLVAAGGYDWPDALRARLRHAAEDYEHIGLTEYGTLDTSAGEQFARAALRLLESAGVAAGQVRAIGSHGQTVLHQPLGSAPFTLQIGDPNVIAERVRIDVVADFRRRDMAAGGQGAPLMPAFHAAAFAGAAETRAVVNIGGIANLTLLPQAGDVLGFDTGPGNCLLDAWARRHLKQPCDQRGAWARSGRVDEPLLAALLAEPYFARPAPKSTGRETFSDVWLERALGGDARTPADVQATLSELTARSIAGSLKRCAGNVRRLFVCGGGAFNDDLMRRLSQALPGTLVRTTADYGIAPEHVEAAGFAWLAHCCVEGLAANLPSVTGARHPVPLGALYRVGTI
ncbi:MAG TPA: anhydro-N-acetylmuramic acid kinase [Steroidobacteraceae bacterium]|nr:anhydro-N-acetylmuramic acid kinase [Steroidobacteraceae bacterium]